MIDSISITYPEFWLEVSETFNKWINIIQWSNWYWKTTIINTIHSLITWSYPWLRTNPKWVATIIMNDNKIYRLIEKEWSKGYEHNQMASYAFPWKFFDVKSTVTQRDILIELLWLDYNKFFQDAVSKLWPDFELLKTHSISELKDKLKNSEWKESILLSDIMKYKAFLKEFVEEDFDDVIQYIKNKDVLIEKIIEYNHSHSTNILDKEISRLRTSLQNLKDKYARLKLSSICPTCKTKLSKPPVEAMDECKEEWCNVLIELNKAIEDLWSRTFIKLWLKHEDLWWSAVVLGIKFVDISESRILEDWEEYKHNLSKFSIYRDDLEDKVKELKELNTEVIKDAISESLKIRLDFTRFLATVIKKYNLDIKLFKILKNWNITETFDILDNWVSYKNLSTWRKMIIEIKLAEIFADKYNVWTICIDEWSIISKDNIAYIKDLSKRMQVIIVKATPWTKADFK